MLALLSAVGKVRACGTAACRSAATVRASLTLLHNSGTEHQLAGNGAQKQQQQRSCFVVNLLNSLNVDCSVEQRVEVQRDGWMEKLHHSPTNLCLCLRLWPSRRGFIRIVSQHFFLQIFQASEVEEEEAEVPEESFTSTKEFKVKKALRTFWDVGML